MMAVKSKSLDFIKVGSCCNDILFNAPLLCYLGLEVAADIVLV